MSFYVTVSATESTILEWDRPRALSIQTALIGIPFTNGISWVGPSPRITRRTVIGSFYGFLTIFTWVLELPGPYSPQGALIAGRQTGALVQQALRSTSRDWSVPTISAYSEAINGPLSWWRSGEAAVTRTRDDFLSEGLQHLQTNDNPVGPNTPLARPPTQGEVAVDIVHNAGELTNEFAKGFVEPFVGSAYKIAVIAIAGGAVLSTVIFWPQISMAVGLAKKAAPRTNPMRRRSIASQILR